MRFQESCNATQRGGTGASTESTPQVGVVLEHVLFGQGNLSVFGFDLVAVGREIEGCGSVHEKGYKTLCRGHRFPLDVGDGTAVESVLTRFSLRWLACAARQPGFNLAQNASGVLPDGGNNQVP